MKRLLRRVWREILYALRIRRRPAVAPVITGPFTKRQLDAIAHAAIRRMERRWGRIYARAPGEYDSEVTPYFTGPVEVAATGGTQ